MYGRVNLTIHGPREPEENMARDREALARAEEGIGSLRVYRWDRPVVSLGKRQRPEDVAEAFPNLPIVARPTGGGAVLHGFDVTIAAAFPLKQLGTKPRELRAAYLRLIQPLADSLNACGLLCGFPVAGKEAPTADCFESVGRMDLADAAGHKVAGCAMAATRSAALLQASIPCHPIASDLELAPAVVSRYTNPAWKDRGFPGVFASAWRAQHRRLRTHPIELVELDLALPGEDRLDAVYATDIEPEMDFHGDSENEGVGELGPRDPGEYANYALALEGLPSDEARADFLKECAWHWDSRWYGKPWVEIARRTRGFIADDHA